jgi:hypothetical protein
MTAPARIRTTISVTPEALAVFKRMGEAANTSTSKIMGDWLADTADAAEMIVLKMEEAKKAPLKVMRELQAMVAVMSGGLDEQMVQVRQLTGKAVRGAAPARSAAGSTPSSNTGVKVPPLPLPARRTKS